MSAHTHREYVEGCYRCDLSRDEAGGISLEPRYVDIGQDYSHCDQCGAPATFTAGWSPPNVAMRVMTRCDEHTPTRRQLEAISAAI